MVRLVPRQWPCRLCRTLTTKTNGPGRKVFVIEWMMFFLSILPLWSTPSDFNVRYASTQAMLVGEIAMMFVANTMLPKGKQDARKYSFLVILLCFDALS